MSFEQPANKVRTSCYIETRIYYALTKIRDDHGVSQSHNMNRALTEYLERHYPAMYKRVILGEDEEN